jgi:hypothetical protein
LFFVALFLFLVAVGGLLAAVFSNPGRKFGGGATFVVASAVGLICLITSCVSFVETRHLGIVKAYGKPTGRVTGAGMQWTKPWEGIDDEWDATRQSFNHLGATCKEPGDGSLWVAIAGQRNMCVRVQVNYDTVTGERAAENWAAYRPRDGKTRFEAFTDYRVNPGINDALLSVFGSYDPLNAIDPKTGQMVSPNLSVDYTPDLITAINVRLGKDIKVESVAWGLLGFDQATTNLISQRGQKILEQGNLKIDGENAATRARIASGTGVPAAVQQCLDLVKVQGKGEPGLCLTGGVQLTKPIS